MAAAQASADGMALPGTRYRFRPGKGVLVIINAANYVQQGQQIPDSAQALALGSLCDQLLTCGFRLVGTLGPVGNDSKRGPTADEIQAFVDGVAETDFADDDAFMLIITAHGREGSVLGWDGNQVLLRDIFRKFQVARSSSMPTMPPALTSMPLAPNAASSG
eukprot:1842618-Prymnesium_polylepis.1